MKRIRIIASVILVAGMIVAGSVITNTSAQESQKSEKPILLMTPADLFSNPKLRELAVAAQHGNVKKIDALIARGGDVNG